MVNVGNNGDIPDVLVHCAGRSCVVKKSPIIPLGPAERKGEHPVRRRKSPPKNPKS
jgi:hypothetical protein